ncbi:MAG: hypothetical protein NC308_01930 [Clostridium sp.]|nr:hypothetical protein [Bacteroides sp.]MCM1197627.1 hypothetical protein [Clostridium sp.]
MKAIDVLKRAAASAAIFLAAVSCKVSAGYESPRTRSSISSYTLNLMYVASEYTVSVIELLVAIDEYENLPEDDRHRPEYAAMRENLRHIDANTIVYSGLGTVYTGGTSFSAPGSSWRLEEEDRNYVYCWTAGVWCLYPGFENGFDILCTGERMWEITSVDGPEMLDIEISGVQSAAVEGKMDFSVKCRGQIARDSEGYGAEFNAAGMKVFNFMDTDDDDIYYYKTVAGEFYLRTFRDWKELDWCRVKSDGNYGYTYESNL